LSRTFYAPTWHADAWYADHWFNTVVSSDANAGIATATAQAQGSVYTPDLSVGIATATASGRGADNTLGALDLSAGIAIAAAHAVDTVLAGISREDVNAGIATATAQGEDSLIPILQANAAIANALAIDAGGNNELVSPERRIDLGGRTAHPEVDVNAYGAVGDGRADDTDAILEAIRVVREFNGGSVCFHAGNYRMRGPMILSDNIRLRSIAPGATRILLTELNEGEAAVFASERDYVTVQDLQIEYIGPDASDRFGVRLVDCLRSSVTNCTLRGFDSGIRAESALEVGTDTYTRNVRNVLQNNRMIEGRSYGIHDIHSESSVITGNYSDETFGNKGVKIEGSRNYHLFGNHSSSNTLDRFGSANFQGPSPYFDVVSYGADPFGVDDSTNAIQRAINDAADMGGGIVFFPPGTFLVSDDDSDDIVIELKANVTLLGSGNFASMISLDDNVNADVLYGVDIPGVCVRDLLIDGNSANNSTGSAIRLLADALSINRVKIQNVEIQTPAEHGIFFEHGDGLYIFQDNIIENLLILKPGGDGIRFDDAHERTSRTTISSVRIERNTDGNGLQLHGHEFLVSDVTVIGLSGATNAGIDYPEGSQSVFSNIRVEGTATTLDDDAGRGIRLGETESITICGMTANDLGDALHLDGALSTSIVGVVSKDCYHGIRTLTNSGVRTTESTTVSGCTSTGCFQGIKIGTSKATTITGCNSRGNDEGLRVLSTAVDTTVVANNFSDNTTAATVWGGTPDGQIEEHNVTS
tara:strand:+ start:505 stop:2778 length:2274 start_codon:yes stop_codon:yes gene_type:complete